MTWFAVYEKATGTLVSTGTVLGDLPSTLAFKELAGRFDSATQEWDPTTLSVKARTPPPPPPDSEIVTLLKSIDSKLDQLLAKPVAGAGGAP